MRAEKPLKKPPAKAAKAGKKSSQSCRTPMAESGKENKAKTKAEEEGVFVKGQSGNPNGRPKKGESIREHLRAMMGETVTIPSKDGSPDKVMTKAEFVSMKMFQLAAGGDLGAIKLCLDHVDGPPKQEIETTGDTGTRIIIQMPPKE